MKHTLIVWLLSITCVASAYAQSSGELAVKEGIITFNVPAGWDMNETDYGFELLASGKENGADIIIVKQKPEDESLDKEVEYYYTHMSEGNMPDKPNAKGDYDVPIEMHFTKLKWVPHKKVKAIRTHYEASHPTNPNYNELRVYIGEPNFFTIMSLGAKNKKEFEIAYPAFKQLVKSYQYIPNVRK